MSQPLLHVKSSNFARLYEEDRDLRGKLLEEYRTLCVVMVYQVVTGVDLLDIQLLTATERAGSRLPKSSEMLITAGMSSIAQKWLKRLPLKFKNESFGAIKISKKNFSAEISPEMKFLDHESNFLCTRNT